MENADTKQKGGTILVPVDYSSYSIQASRYAAKVAAKSGGDLCLLHTYYSPAFDLIELSGGLNTQQQLRAEVNEKLEEDETLTMNEFVNKLYTYQEFKSIDHSRVTSKIKAGLAKEEIISFTHDTQPEMVILGTRGADKKNTSILGSITEAAIKKLNVPVIAIPEEYKFIGEENLRKVVYLTDYDESDFMSIKKLMLFTNLFDMQIHCVHIGASTDKWELLKMEGLKDYFKKIYSKEQVECHILSNQSNLLEAIDKYVTDNQINLIALTHRKRNLIKKIFNPSLARKIFYHTEQPLLVFHS